MPGGAPDSQPPNARISGSTRLRVCRFEHLPSTSRHARSVVETDGVHTPALFVAREQAGGVGRFGRPWASPLGGLWFTLVIPVDRPAIDELLPGLGLRLGLACLDAIDEIEPASTWRERVRLKWPNDVLVDGRKVLGILTELVTTAKSSALLVGVGVNANFALDALPSVLHQSATTLRLALGRDVDLGDLERGLVGRILTATATRGTLDTDRRRALDRLHGLNQGAPITLPTGERVVGMLRGLDELGQAMVEINGALTTLPAGAAIMLPSE